MIRLLTELAARGLVHEATPGLADRLERGPITGYVGFDPTADSLHVGNLVPVMALAWLQRCGGRPVVLVGGGTAMVGDPSGKRAERPVLALSRIEANAAAIGSQLRRFLDFDGPAAARLVDNADWLRQLGLMEFLRDTGKHFTVNYMLQKESVRNRMETGISFTEFSYMLVQAYDYWHLHRTMDCELQMGGSDQWGNITAGIELIGRRESRTVHGLVLPLLTTASGAKFGKTEDGNVWLDPAKTSPYRFYQFWLNADDRDVERLLRTFTFLPVEEISALLAEHAADPGRRLAQRRLADEMTARVHGLEETARAREASAQMFVRDRSAGTESRDYDALATAVPTHPASRAELAAGLPLVDALVRVGLASSKADARRGLTGRGYSVNDLTESDPGRRITEDDLRQGRYVLLRKGKKNYALLVVD